MDSSNIEWRVCCSRLCYHMGLRNRIIRNSSDWNHNDFLHKIRVSIRNDVQLQSPSKECNWSWFTDISFHNCCSDYPRFSNNFDKRRSQYKQNSSGIYLDCPNGNWRCRNYRLHNLMGSRYEHLCFSCKWNCTNELHEDWPFSWYNLQV